MSIGGGEVTHNVWAKEYKMEILWTASNEEDDRTSRVHLPLLLASLHWETSRVSNKRNEKTEVLPLYVYLADSQSIYRMGANVLLQPKSKVVFLIGNRGNNIQRPLYPFKKPKALVLCYLPIVWVRHGFNHNLASSRDNSQNLILLVQSSQTILSTRDMATVT